MALDLSAAALGQFRARLGARLPERLTLARASVYELPFPDGAFDAVVSFGYASAASYEGAEWEVARVLRPGGVAVVDFANPSLYHWLAAPRPTWRWLQRYRDPAQAQYHFGWRGLRGTSRRPGCGWRRCATSTPIRHWSGWPGSRGARALDRGLAAVAGPVLGRVLLARLRRA